MQQNDDAAKRHETKAVVGMLVVAHEYPPEIVEPREKPFDLPASPISAER
jgi:hypothetical protein